MAIRINRTEFAHLIRCFAESERKGRLDWSKPLLCQLHEIAEHYDKWVNTAVYRHCRLFGSPILESLTYTPWYLVPVVWIPIILYFGCTQFFKYVWCVGFHTKMPKTDPLRRDYDRDGSGVSDAAVDCRVVYSVAAATAAERAYSRSVAEPLDQHVLYLRLSFENVDGCVNRLTMLQYLMHVAFGVFIWTIIEYSLHRWLFHLNPGRSLTMIKLHFLIHGLHHKVPFDGLRQVFPPVPAMAIASVLYLPVSIIFNYPLIKMTGGLIGYLIYDMIHYYVHHGSPADGTYLYTMKRYHSNHHFLNHDKGIRNRIENKSVTRNGIEIMMDAASPVDTENAGNHFMFTREEAQATAIYLNKNQCLLLSCSNVKIVGSTETGWGVITENLLSDACPLNNLKTKVNGLFCDLFKLHTVAIKFWKNRDLIGRLNPTFKLGKDASKIGISYPQKQKLFLICLSKKDGDGTPTSSSAAEEKGPITLELVAECLRCGREMSRAAARRGVQLARSGVTLEACTPALLHFYSSNLSPDTKKTAESSNEILTATKLMQIKLCSGCSMTPNTFLSFLEHQVIRLHDVSYCKPVSIRCSPLHRYRRIDGRCNNLRHPGWGRRNAPFTRIAKPRYADGVYSMPLARSGRPLPNVRVLSIFALSGSLHVVEVTECCLGDGREVLPPEWLNDKCIPIKVPDDDPFYSRHGIKCLNFVRSVTTPRDDCSLGHAEQMNTVTSYLDGSPIYGSEPSLAYRLRTLSRGKMRTSNRFGNRKGYLPQVDDKFSVCDLRNASEPCYLAGDVRINQTPTLALLHTLLLREHNRIAGILHHLNPLWSDERLYQEARRIVIAELQHITYQEWLPLNFVDAILEKVEQDRDIRFYNKAEELEFNDEGVFTHLKKAGYTKKLNTWFPHELTEKDLKNGV
ncbi:Chorion peroxidase [Eumeta japonica]|uniref:Chorion peroxidase n=1 Tax=Eumeta variegata TaxID=151549 RepID=A0A4C1XTW6_EUMVA|nr:Chorion peroxidase [Eumeta japonica]